MRTPGIAREVKASSARKNHSGVTCGSRPRRPWRTVPPRPWRAGQRSLPRSAAAPPQIPLPTSPSLAARPLPGSGPTAARHDHLAARLRAARLRAAGPGALAGLGFTGLGPGPGDPVIITGCKSTPTSKTTPAQRHANQALSAARAPVEHGFSDLKNWRILTCLRLSPANATTLLRALLVLPRQRTTR